MRVQKKLSMVALILAILASAISVFAQEAPQQKAEPQAGRDVIIERRNVEVTVQGQAEILAPPAGVVLNKIHGDNTFVFVSSEMSFDRKVVKGAPYSAQAVTEMIQTLSDGNRIVRKNTASVYRDGEGRTRHEQTLTAIGPWATAGDPPQTIFINDPVAGINYVLDPRSRTARKITVSVLPLSGKPGEITAIAPPKVAPAPSPASARAATELRVAEDVFVTPAMPPAPGGVSSYSYYHRSASPPNAKTESLGKQTIEGVVAEGTRTTITIPAGEIGNELPINIVSERWYSPELQTVVMTKNSDPRMGETVFRLTNINRSEPSRSLFEVPADYTIKEGAQSFIRTLRNKRPNQE